MRPTNYAPLFFRFFRFLPLPLLFSFVCLLGLLGSWGCGSASGQSSRTVPVITTDDPEAEALYRNSLRAERDGRIDEAEEGYREFIARFEEDPLRYIVRLQLGRLLLARADEDHAIRLLEEAREHGDEETRERAALYLGLAKHLRDENQDAIALLEPLSGKLIDAEERALHQRTLAAACLAVRDYLCGLEALDSLSRRDESGKMEEDEEDAIGTIVNSELREEELAELYERLPREGKSWELVAKRHLMHVYASGDLERAQAIASALRAENVELTGELLALTERAEDLRKADKDSIGLILPLSGRHQEVGNEALRGVNLATGRFGRGLAARSDASLLIRDNAGDPERTVRAMDELIAVHRVIAIIGALDGPTALAAAKRAEEAQIPFISLSASGFVQDESQWAFRMLPSALHEARELASAAKEEGARRVAILRPEQNYAERVAGEFREAARSVGIEIVADLSYAEGTRDFRSLMDELRKGAPDFIFLPDRPARIAILAPTLAAASLWSPPASARGASGIGTRLILPSASFDESLLGREVRYLEGAIVALPYRLNDEVNSIIEEYRERYGRSPSVFASSAYDAYRMVREGVVRRGAETREALRDALEGAAPEIPLSPSAGFNEGRAPKRQLAAGVIRDGKLEALNAH